METWKKSEVTRDYKVFIDKEGKYFITCGADADWFFGNRGTRVYKKDLPKTFEVTRTYTDWDV